MPAASVVIPVSGQNLALFHIGLLTGTCNTVFCSANGAHFGFERQSHHLAGSGKTSGIFQVCFKRTMTSVIHYRGISAANTGHRAFIRSMVQMYGHWNRDIHVLHQGFGHPQSNCKATHVGCCFACHTKNKRTAAFFSSFKNRLCPFKVVYIEMADRVMAILGFIKHFFSIDKQSNFLLLVRPCFRIRPAR